MNAIELLKQQRGLVAPGVAVAALVFVGQRASEATLGLIGEGDGNWTVLAGVAHGLAQRGNVRRFQVAVEQADVAQAGAHQATQDGSVQRRGDVRWQRNSAGKVCPVFSHGVGQRGRDYSGDSKSVQPPLGATGQFFRQIDVGAEGEVRAVGLGGTDRQEHDRVARDEIAHGGKR